MDDQIRELWQVERNAAVAHFADAEIREKIAEVLHEYQYTGLERARKFLPEESFSFTGSVLESHCRGFKENTARDCKESF